MATGFAALSIGDNDVVALDRIAKVESRCAPAALAFLRQLKQHPCFDALVERLERIDNTISRADVEDAYEEVNKGLPPTGKKD